MVSPLTTSRGTSGAAKPRGAIFQASTLAEIEEPLQKYRNTKEAGTKFHPQLFLGLSSKTGGEQEVAHRKRLDPWFVPEVTVV